MAGRSTKPMTGISAARAAAARDRQIHDLRIKARYYQFLEATLRQNGGWLASDIDGTGVDEIKTKGDYPEYFGLDPDEPDKLFLQVDTLTAMNPEHLRRDVPPGHARQH